MLKVSYVFFLAFLLSFPVSSKSNPSPLSTVNSEVKQLQQQIQQLQTDLKATKNDKEYHDKLIVLSQGLADLEKRVEDIHQYVAYWGWSSGIAIALFGTLLTGLIIFFSLRTSSVAIAEAKQAAEKEVKIWLDEKGDKAIKPLIDSLQKNGAEILVDIQRQGNEAFENLKTKLQLANALEDKLQTLLDRAEPSLGKTVKELNPNDMVELQRITEQLRQKPENEYSFDDWRVLYSEATNRNALAEVGKYVEGMKRTAADNWQNATAKIGEAWLLCEREQYAEAIKLYDQIIAEYSASNDPHLIERVASAIFARGFPLGKQGQWKDEIAAYDEVVSRYDNHNEAGIAEVIAAALFNKGVVLDDNSLPKDAIDSYSKVVSRYGECSEASIAVYVASALYNKGVLMGKQGQWEAAIAAYDEVVSRYESRSEADIAVMVAKALCNKGLELAKQGQCKDEIAAYDKTVSLYGARIEANIVNAVAKAQINRANSLRDLKRTFEAKVAYAMFIERYASRTESKILANVEEAKKAINELTDVLDKN